MIAGAKWMDSFIAFAKFFIRDGLVDGGQARIRESNH
jgi:hypothetical protein